MKKTLLFMRVSLIVLASLIFSVGVYAANSIEVSIFNNDGIAAVSGVLDENKVQRIAVTVLNNDRYNSEPSQAAASLIFANDLYSDANGCFNFNINMPSGADTGSYYLVITADNQKIYDESIHYSKDSSAALDKINKATSGDSVASVIENNQDELEFFYDGIYDRFDSAMKKNVGMIIYNEKERLKKINRVGYVIDDKAYAVKDFRKAVTVVAVTNGEISDIDAITKYFDKLNSGTVYEWISFEGGININQKIKLQWQSGIIDRLKGQSCITFEDFEKQFKAALIFEVIKNPDGYGNIKSIVNSYIQNDDIDLNEKYVTNSVCSKLIGKNYTGFDYSKLISDIKKYFEDSNESGSASSGGGSSVTIGGTLSPSETLTPINPNNANLTSVDCFTDISNSWARDVINSLAKEGVVSGVGENLFAPNAYITREEFVTIVSRSLGLVPEFSGNMPFSDIDEKAWYYNSILSAYQTGLINGMDNNEFGIGKYITRQDIVVILDNVIKLRNIELTESKKDFMDFNYVSDYAKDSVGNLAGIGIINGYEDKSFKPLNNATRAEVANIIYNFRLYLEDIL